MSLIRRWCRYFLPPFFPPPAVVAFCSCPFFTPPLSAAFALFLPPPPPAPPPAPDPPPAPPPAPPFFCWQKERWKGLRFSWRVNNGKRLLKIRTSIYGMQFVLDFSTFSKKANSSKKAKRAVRKQTRIFNNSGVPFHLNCNSFSWIYSICQFQHWNSFIR